MSQPHICSFVPGYYLQRIIDSGSVTAEERDCFQKTIDQNRALHDARIEHCHQLQATQPAPLPQAVASERVLNRTIFDVKNGTNLSRARKVRGEGDPAISITKDQSNDVNECYDGLKTTYDLLYKFFLRNSLDGKGLALNAFVHYGENYGNAYWDGSRLVFGDGSSSFNGFTDELDIIAHEMGHGIVQFTMNLEYEYQIGALNESISDVFGIMVKQWSEHEANTQAERGPSWLIGEGLWRTQTTRPALRDMKNPGKAFDRDNQPAHWSKYKKLKNDENGDWGGVHINSGIPNRAFYLAVTKIGKNSWEGAGPIWYKAVTDPELRNKSRTGFREFADATIKHAGQHVDDVEAAWKEVGYPFPGREWELLTAEERKPFEDREL